nr:S-layer homology domain-containing protein [Acidimicrobiia bacterium]
EGVNAFTEFSGDPLQIIVWPNDTRRYSVGTDKIGVYLCTWPGALGGINLTDAVSTLNAEVTDFYFEISGGAYLPSFIKRTTLMLDDGVSPWADCEQAMKDNAATGDNAALGILDNDSNAGLATPGPSCLNSQTCSWGTTFPDNQRWAIIEGESVKSFGVYDAHITTAAHEVGHTINFPHSYSGVVLYDFQGQPYVDEYDNPIDYMSGNMPGGLLGRRVEYPYSTLAFNRYRAGWVDESDVVFYAGGVTELTLAPVGVDGVQMVVLPTGYQYSLVTLDARANSSLDPVPSNFAGISAHYIEQWWRNPDTDVVEPVGGALSRVYTYPPSPDSLDHVTRVGEQATLDVDQGEELLAQGTLLKVLGETADGFQIKLIGFDDVADSVFLGNILWLAESGITKGCTDTSFCPDEYVTRGQMAAFLTRALGYTDDGGGDLFTDDDGNIFEPSIDRLATAGVTKGCNPPINDNYCPNDFVTREQMAAFLVRALGLTDDGGGNNFIDDNNSIFETQIAILAEAGITKGCNPPENTQFCPYDRVTREQMAAFLERALG